jgi:hypothetical protein
MQIKGSMPMKSRSRIPLPFILSLALLLAACGGAAAPPAAEQPTAAPAPTSAPAAEQPTAAPAPTSAPAAEQPTTAPAQTTDSGGASGKVTALLIGLPDEDTVDSVTGKPVPGVKKLEEMFKSSHPNIDLNIVNIPWGSGATGYQPKTEAMIQANESCIYMMPGASDFGHRGLQIRTSRASGRVTASNSGAVWVPTVRRSSWACPTAVATASSTGMPSCSKTGASSRSA